MPDNKVTIADFRKAWESCNYGIDRKVCDRWFKLSGDVNPLEHGAKFVRLDEGSRWECSELALYEEGTDPTYTCVEFSGDIADLLERFDYLSFSDLNVATEWDTLSDLYRDLITAFTAYGWGQCDSADGNNAADLLGFRPDKQWLHEQGEFFQVEVD